MLRRLFREEAGMTMGLVVIMIVLIGVMGAGLLTFVQRDLETVVEVNQGQKATEVSDAGVEAAKRQLLLTSFPAQYDGTSADNVDWAYNSASTACGDLPSGSGKCIATPEGNVRVAIRYLPPPTVPLGIGTNSRTDPNFAPEDLPLGATDYPDKRDYFRVEADGIFSGARRRIQAILVTEDLGLPKAYFATKDIDLGPSCSALTVTDISLFARGNITNFRTCSLQGTDLAYGDWFNNPGGGTNGYNVRVRQASTGTPVTGNPAATGAAAEGSIEYKDSEQRSTPAAVSDRYKRVDFDSAANLTGSGTQPTPNYKFCDRGTLCWPTGTSQPFNVITYPFNDSAELNADLLRSFAEEQGNYIEQPGSGPTVTVNQTTFNQISPQPLSSVFVVKFTGSTPGQVNIKPTGSASPTCPIKGTILVINGSVDTSSSGAQCFDGIVSVQDPNNLGTLDYDSTGGNFVLNGFLSIEGKITLGGNVRPILGLDVLNQPGYHDVKLWSWRECYNDACS